VTFIIAAILIARFPPGSTNNHAASWGFIIVTWIFNFSFSATVGPLSWIIPAEIFDTRTRSKGVSIATMVSFAFNTLIGQITGIAIVNIGYRYYFLFIVCNFTNALFFYLFLPETARLPLEEMNYLFTNAPWLVARHDKGYISLPQVPFRVVGGTNLFTEPMQRVTLMIWRGEPWRLKGRGMCMRRKGRKLSLRRGMRD
jgi:MFS family permease